jgi:hypothetical protein
MTPFNSKVERILKIYNTLYADHLTYAALWQELAEYIIPRKSDMLWQSSPGEKKTDKVFDSSAIHSNELLAAAMQGTITNHATKWFGLRMRNDALNGIKAIKEWLEDCSQRMFHAFNQSNFHSEVHESYLDLGAFGTSGLFMEENPADNQKFFPGFNFRAMSLKEFCISEGPDGRVNAVYRRFSMELYAAFKEFGEALIKDDPALAEKLVTKPYERYEILHCVYPRDFPDPRKGGKGLAWESTHILLKRRRLLRESGYHEFPFLVPRWTKASGEIWGRGPGNTALPDIKTLNRAVELTLKALAKSIDPPLGVLDDGVVGQTVDMRAGGVNVIREKGAIESLVTRGEWDFANLEIDTLKSAIVRVFFADQLQLQEGPQMTAHEVSVRYELMQRLLGPTLGRLEQELLNPLIERAFGMMLRADALLPPPSELTEAIGTGEEIDIEYESPLALAQRAQELQGMERALTLLTPLVEVKPDIVDNFDLDEFARHASMLAGMPSKILNDRKKIEKIRAGRVKAQKDQKGMDEELQGSQVLKNLAPVVKELNQPGGANSGVASEAEGPA